MTNDIAEQKADAILKASTRLLQTSSFDALLDALSDVIQILISLTTQSQTGLSPLNKNRIGALLNLLSKIHLRLDELSKMQLGIIDADEDNSKEHKLKIKLKL